MKKLIFPLIIIAALFFMGSCSTKFNVAAPYQNITVIDAFLDMADTAHYIRVQKAFLDGSRSALTMAQVPDSSFYANINVKIERFMMPDTVDVTDTIHLYRVDLDKEGYPKQPGTFFNSPNYAYKFTNTLNPAYLYRIVVTNLTTGQRDSSTSPVIDDVTPGVLLTDIIDDSSNHGMIDFSAIADPTNDYVTINTSYNLPPNITYTFEGQSVPAYVSDIIVTFNWIDSNYTNGSETSRSCTYDLGYQLMTGGAVEYNSPNIGFFDALASGMGTAPASTDRLLGRLGVTVYVGTLDFYNYQQNSMTQGVGLTGNEIEPVYTNVYGLNALGLYTSRGIQSGLLTLTPMTVTALLASPLLTNAHITGTAYH